LLHTIATVHCAQAGSGSCQKDGLRTDDERALNRKPCADLSGMADMATAFTPMSAGRDGMESVRSRASRLREERR
jgi:hypothetical protein